MKIKNLMGNIYQVVNEDDTSTLFQGTLSECQYYIQINTL